MSIGGFRHPGIRVTSAVIHQTDVVKVPAVTAKESR